MGSTVKKVLNAVPIVGAFVETDEEKKLRRAQKGSLQSSQALSQIGLERAKRDLARYKETAPVRLAEGAFARGMLSPNLTAAQRAQSTAYTGAQQRLAEDIGLRERQLAAQEQAVRSGITLGNLRFEQQYPDMGDRLLQAGAGLGMMYLLGGAGGLAGAAVAASAPTQAWNPLGMMGG